MTRPTYYDRAGNPMYDVFVWAKLRAERDYTIVEQTELPGDVWVSTVWLGIDHNFSDVGPPLIFETMIFGPKEDEYQERYSTEAEARAGHHRAVAEWRRRSIRLT